MTGAALHTGCDRAAAEARPGGATAKPILVLSATILASSLAFIDGSVVNVGLPAIGKALNAGAGDLQWVVNAYLLPLSALLLLGGAAGDRFGRLRLLVIGIVLFALASIGCALAPSVGWLLAGRGWQGVGAALLMPNSLAVLGASFEGEARGRAVGTWAAVGAVAGAVGPVLGGWLIDAVGWRWIFAINLPLAAAAIALAVVAVKDPPRDKEGAPLDTLGGVLATLALGALTWGLTVGSGPGGWTPLAIGVSAAGGVFAAAFIGVEGRRGDRAMAPLALFGSGEFVGLTLLTALLYGALGALLVLVPYVLIRAGGYSAVGAGAALLPFPIILSLTSPLMGGLAGKIGARLPLSIGPLVVAAGFLLALRIDGHGGYWTEVFPAILVIALGMSGAVAPLTTAVLASVDGRHTGAASGLNSAVARTGGLVATALLGGVLGASGAALIGAFRLALVICAVACVAAGASAFLLIRAKAKAKP